MKSASPINQRLELAHSYVLHTNQNVFLTGKAGTGKTTFLHQIKQLSAKRLVVVAPTGVAAINAGGVTIHSLFQLPFGPIIPGAKQENRKFSREKIRLLRTLDLLVIDEISMVRADVLDGIDEVLRRYRYSQEPFGGVQLLLIGDMQQLPPVIRDDDWALLRPYYESGYFFSSHALRETPYVSIELTHIYRQADQRFINLLNGIREKTITAEGLADLNQRYVPDFTPNDRDGYITLATHNQTAQQINSQKLTDLTTRLHTYEAVVTDDFPEPMYPAEFSLELKVGAQVMFVKNDSSPDKQYYNGKIGQIAELGSDYVSVKCAGEFVPIVTGPVEWQNIRYSLDAKTGEIQSEIIGTFTQYPLRLAWAITIHKSQGLTFERAIIDAGRAFAHGQVYVALSRCKTLDGLVLRTPIPASSIKTEFDLERFHEDVQTKTPTEQHLHNAKRANQEQLLHDLFAFEQAAYLLSRVRKVVDDNVRTLPAPLVEQLNELQTTLTDKARVVGHRFRKQLPNYFGQEPLPEANTDLQQRIQKAGAYFKTVLADELLPLIYDAPTDTDNKQVRTDLLEALDELERELTTKLALFTRCAEGFDALAYLQVRNQAELAFMPNRKKVERAAGQPDKAPKAGDRSNRPSSLYFELLKWRGRMAEEHNSPAYFIMSQQTVTEIATKRPETIDALAKIKGVGKAKAKRIGDEILAIIEQNPADGRPDGPPAPKANVYAKAGEAPARKATNKADKEPVYEATLKLFLLGKSIAAIAELRGVTEQTIENHLTRCINLGLLPVEAVLSAEKLTLIYNTLGSKRPASLTDAVQQLDGLVSYTDLRFAYAAVGR
ncbi:ATP-dependent DNA helicase PIF1 [Fibrella aestuarina BUZ 2]|uniref:ATP-dependent DNA helicase PIF1 n=1 Tax=Fibrella aestuarina BUZ 2 TaxID=1166018 RepID=I0KEL2_9BACT|nr:HRDC domain-containing protein [Fibrella aestuarina]CCH02565.1 ATP-dependent DNA helicase PIF1 [Fibrella aestuarina BUZ 2]